MMRGRGLGLALALAAVLLCLGTTADAARALQQDRVCRFSCAIGLVCIDGLCQGADNPAVVSLSTPAAGPSAAVPASGESGGRELPMQEEPVGAPLESITAEPSPEEITAQEAASMSFMDTSAAPSPGPDSENGDTPEPRTGAISVVVVKVPVRRTPPAQQDTAVEVGGR